jgi:biopolymer transport protein TolQ
MPASTAIEVAAVAGSVAAGHDLSVWGLIAQADVVVKFVMAMLMCASIGCWAIIFDKWTYFKKVKFNSVRFERAYRSSKAVDTLFDKMDKKEPGSPLAAMYVAGMQEVRNSYPSGRKADIDALNIFREKLLNSVHRVKHIAMDRMEKKLIFLATVGSASPFIGLFGTVWGIVNSFQAIGATKNTTLAVVAPGIAEALLATAIGLFAAIPAVIFYNFFSNEIRLCSGKMDDFANELGTSLVYQSE